MVSLVRTAKLQVGLLRSALLCSSVKATSGYIFQVQPRLQLQWGPHRAAFCSTTAPSGDVTVQYKHGHPVLAIPLPSRGERCLFSLKPTLNVGDFIQDVQREDPGVTAAAVLSTEGESLSLGISLESLLRKDFQILINDVTFRVHCPTREVMSSGQLTHLEHVKPLVHMLHKALNLPRHQQLQEKELLENLAHLRHQLLPMEKVKSKVEQRAERRCSWAVWGGLAVLSLQGGVLAWFTWWVYSWDVMEPITYFLTCSTSIGFLSYYILTQQEFEYANAKDRQFLHYFYKVARRQGFDVRKYNELKQEVTVVEDNLRRLRKRIHLGLLVEQTQPKA